MKFGGAMYIHIFPCRVSSLSELASKGTYNIYLKGLCLEIVDPFFFKQLPSWSAGSRQTTVLLYILFDDFAMIFNTKV